MKFWLIVKQSIKFSLKVHLNRAFDLTFVIIATYSIGDTRWRHVRALIVDRSTWVLDELRSAVTRGSRECTCVCASSATARAYTIRARARISREFAKKCARRRACTLHYYDHCSIHCNTCRALCVLPHYYRRSHHMLGI